MSTQTTSAGISNLLVSDEVYPAPPIVAENAILKDFEAEYQRSITDAEGFWAGYARKFEWFRKWNRVSEFDGIHHRWFVGARTNITVNALDRHANSERRNRVAFIFLNEEGTEHQITYGQLYQMVCRFANGLKSLGVRKGDRVIIYMPLTIEGVISMLACARIGAIHSVVYAGLGYGALRSRIQDAGARAILAGDVGFRRGKTVALKSILDEAIGPLDFVEKIVVFSRSRPAAEAMSRREIDFFDLMKFSAECPAEAMEAEDPLFILYTSGTTGFPKGVVHVHGGFMVGTTYHLENYYDVGARDIFWCTSDIGWIVGHSYIVYGPLCAGVTTLFREGAIDYPNPGIAWEIVERYGVSKMFTAPTAIRMFMRFGGALPAKHDLSSLRLIACAGEPLNPEAWRWAQTHLGGDGKWGYVVDNWWQTELGGPTIGTHCTLATHPGKAGLPLPGVEAEILDNESKPCPAGIGGRLGAEAALPSHGAHGVE